MKKEKNDEIFDKWINEEDQVNKLGITYLNGICMSVHIMNI